MTGVSADVAADEFEGPLRAGATFDGGPARRQLDATMLRHYLTDRAGLVDPFGIRLRGVDIVGPLSAEAINVPFPLMFQDCRFECPVELNGSTLHALGLVDCTLPALVGNGLRLRRNLTLSGSRLDGAVETTTSTSYPAALWLCEADIGGRFTAMGTYLNAHGGRAIHADGLRVRGAVRLFQGFAADGEVRLVAAQIGAGLDAAGARFSSQGRWALHLAEAQIGGSLLLVRDAKGNGTTINGQLDLEDAWVGGQLLVTDARLSRPTGTGRSYLEQVGDRHTLCLWGPRLKVDGAVVFDGATVLDGGVDVSSSQMSSLRLAPTIQLKVPGEVALDLTRATIQGMVTLGPDLAIEGTVAMAGAKVGGDLRLTRIALSQPSQQSLLRATGITVEGLIDLRQARFDGGAVRLVDSAIAGTVDLSGAQLSHLTVEPDQSSEGQSLNLRSARVRGSVRLGAGFSSHGQVILTRAEIEGWLECDGGSFVGPAPTRENPDSDALTAISARVVRGLYLDWTQCTPSADFSSLETTQVSDDPTAAPARLVLSGFSYDRFTPPRNRPQLDPWDPLTRCLWLERQPVFDVGAYEQAARVYARHGRIPGAETILMHQRDLDRKLLLTLRPWVRTGSPTWWRQRIGYLTTWWYGRLFGYGYRPLRAVGGILALLALVVVGLQIPLVTGTLRAADSRGNVYAPDGRLVSVVDDGTATQLGPAVRAQRQVVPDACGGGQVRCFDPVLYAVDTVVPLVALDQRATWYVDPQAPWGRWVGYLLAAATLLGWVLSTTLVLSLARLSRTLQS